MLQNIPIHEQGSTTGEQSVRPGDQLCLKVSLVDPRRDKIRFQEVTQQKAQQAAG